MRCLSYSASFLSVLFACSIVSAQHRWFEFPSELGLNPYGNTNDKQYTCDEHDPQYECVFYNVSIGRYDRGTVRFGHEDVTRNYHKNVTFRQSSISVLPETLLDTFVEIELLDLTNLQIERIEPFALTYGKIRELYMGSNVIQNLPIFAFRNMRLLQVLVLDRNKLTNLPEGIFHGTPQLLALSIADNNLKRINDSTFKKTKGLKFLRLHSNKLTHLDLSLIPSLINGNVSFNQLTTLAIPEAILELDASNNRIKTVTGPNNKVLAILRLQHNKLSDTAWLPQYSGLVDVDLSHNELENVTYHHFQSLYRLERLYLSNNKLVTLNLDSSSIRTLQILDVRQNQLRSVLLNQQQFDSLEQLYLDHNSLVTFNLRSDNKLNKLTLSHNQWNCKHLEQLIGKVSETALTDSDRQCKAAIKPLPFSALIANEADEMKKDILTSNMLLLGELKYLQDSMKGT